jgi:hypothetical protein
MLHLKPSFSVSSTMSKYIMDCTNKSMERRLNRQSDLLINNIDVSELDVKKTFYICSFFSFISFLAGYHFKSIQN